MKIECQASAVITRSVATLVLIANPCHAYDPNTYIIKHQSGKNSKAILDKKFIHVAAPQQIIIDQNNTDSKGLEALTTNVQKAITIKPSKQIIKPSKTKILPGKNQASMPVKDNSNWDDFAIEGSSAEDCEELNVKAVIVN